MNESTLGWRVPILSTEDASAKQGMGNPVDLGATLSSVLDQTKPRVFRDRYWTALVLRLWLVLGLERLQLEGSFGRRAHFRKTASYSHILETWSLPLLVVGVSGSVSSRYTVTPASARPSVDHLIRLVLVLQRVVSL
jgi:hypothetical protein